MSYPLEGLNPERFQQLCQAILIREFPGLTCFPVGQPDGGRDAIQTTSKLPIQFNVFQIKFVRNPTRITDVDSWTDEIINSELPKIERLAAKGAQRYILVTNISGTAHLDTGSIDKVNRRLASRISIPTGCMWRDDLERRLDGLWDIKLAFPEVLSGSDFLRLLLESNSGQNAARQTRAIKSFLADQYAEELEVKFRQIDLQANIFDLFIDLPFEMRLTNHGKSHLRLAQSTPGLHVVPENDSRNRLMIATAGWDDNATNSATMLLNYIDHIPTRTLVIWGAPGQGKSTLTQYICQIHRLRWLGRERTKNILERHLASPLRIPIRVEFRDFAAWTTRSEVGVAIDDTSLSARTAEEFLAGEIHKRSGGAGFSVDDLFDIARQAPLLIVFDGLDEVADVQARNDVIHALTRMTNRLRDVCPDACVIATSRPAAFSNSAGLPESDFPILQLGSVSPPASIAYANRWAAARRLSAKETTELADILREKIAGTHIRVLTQNPMQLAIVISLVHTQGSALPDKRTTLYDEYVNLFFSREASKNVTVRTNLDLLKDIHRYLGWSLHCAAESPNSSGRINREQLRDTLITYLDGEGHPTTAVDALFTAVAERVVMIVQRIQGLYEFEIQPLREYFAARYLYNTASYSPAGMERTGTKPDRFEVISRNAYWLNVTRFYCGCYSKGELLDLAEGVIDLINDAFYGRSRHGVSLLAMLLSDWVFNQSPKSVQRLSQILEQSECLRRLYPDSHQYSFVDESSFRLPPATGGTFLGKKSLSIALQAGLPFDIAARAAEFASQHVDNDQVDSLWIEQPAEPAPGYAVQWLRLGDILGSLSRVDATAIIHKINLYHFDRSISGALFDAGRIDVISHCPSAHDELEYCLFDKVPRRPMQSHSPPLYRLPSILSAICYLGYGIGGSVEALFRRIEIQEPRQEALDLQKDCHLFNVAWEIDEFIRRSFETSESKLGVVNEISAHAVKICAQEFGNRGCLSVASLVLRGRRSTKRVRKLDVSIFDNSLDILERTKFAFWRRKDSSFWLEQLSDVSNSNDRLHFYLLCITLCPSEVLLEIIEPIGQNLDSVDEAEWLRLLEWISFGARTIFMGRFPMNTRPEALPQSIISARMAILLTWREPSRYKRDCFLRYLRGDAFGAPEMRLVAAIEACQAGLIPWSEGISIITDSYSQGATANTARRLLYGSKRTLPVEVASLILDNPAGFPVVLWEAAERVAVSLIGKASKPVGEIANKQRWFS